MNVQSVLTKAPQTLGQIAVKVDEGVPPWQTVTPLGAIRGDLAALVASGVAVRVTLLAGIGWRLAGAT